MSANLDTTTTQAERLMAAAATLEANGASVYRVYRTGDYHDGREPPGSGRE
jgi:hypothetical protein